MENDPIEKILPSLLAKSAAGEVNWTSINKKNDEDFIVVFPKFSIRIKQSWDGDREEIFYTLSIFDDEGRRLESRSYSNESKEVSDLFNFARMRALNIDTAIDEIMAELNKPGIIGTLPPQDEEFPF